MDDLDRRLINRLQRGLPLVRDPWQVVAAELESSSAELLDRLHQLLEDGVLTVSYTHLTLPTIYSV